MSQEIQFNPTAAWAGHGEAGFPLTSANLVGVKGFNSITKARNAVHKLKLLECARMWNSFLAGEIKPYVMMEAIRPTDEVDFQRLQKLAPHIFHEAMTTSDFLNLTTYVLDRLMLDNYATYPFTYDRVCRIHNKVRDFRNVERWRTDLGENPWQKVLELEGFNRGKLATSKYTYNVAKYEGGDQVSWEAVINDDMDMFGDLASRLALGGGRTIEQFFCNLIADVNGPNASFYTSGNANIINTTSYYSGGTNNPVLNYNNLAGAIAQFMGLATSQGRPINVANDKISVLVGDPFLYQVLMNIVNTQFIATTVAGGSKASAAVMYDTSDTIKNWLASKIEPIFCPELRNIVTASSGAPLKTAWWLFISNNMGKARTAIEIGFLQGYDKPQLYRKLPNTIRVTGGSVDEMGDFETMATEIKGLLVVGGTRMDPILTLASSGAGS